MTEMPFPALGPAAQQLKPEDLLMLASNYNTTEHGEAFDGFAHDLATIQNLPVTKDESVPAIEKFQKSPGMRLYNLSPQLPAKEDT